MLTYAALAAALVAAGAGGPVDAAADDDGMVGVAGVVASEVLCDLAIQVCMRDGC